MWQFLKDYHFYSTSDKRAILVLLTLIAFTIGVTLYVEHNYQRDIPPQTDAQVQAFADSLQQVDSLRANRRRAYAESRSNVERQPAKPVYQPRPRYERPERPATQHRDTTPRLLLDTLPRYEKTEKYQPGTVVDLNKADTTELKKIPGIGTVIANMIVNYRNQLGGYYEVEQLREINLDADQLMSWFSIDEADIRKIPVNRANVDRLRRHPYINFYQAKALVEHRRKHGDLTSLKPFVLSEEFTEAELEKINHYLSFD